MGWPEQAASAQNANLAAFGEGVEYTVVGATSPASVRGIFCETFTSLDTDTGVAISTHQPNLFVVIADLPATPRQLDSFVRTATATRYVVEDVQRDGEGGAYLLAKRAAA